MYWKSLRHILLHKWYVWEECKKVGLYWQGIVHDLSKLLPVEFGAYARKFYSESKEESKKVGYTNEFKFAWLHHQHKNKHHWNYWIVDQNKKEALPMHKHYALEMICDWKATGRELNDTAMEFYLRVKDKIILAPETRVFVESTLNVNNCGRLND